MNLELPCSKGCKRLVKYGELDDHEKQCDGQPVNDDEEVKIIADDDKFKQLLFVLDRSKPEIIRFDVVNKSRIKISVLFTKDGKTPFPAL